MRLLLCLLSASVATSLRAAPRFSFLQTGVAAGVAMMGMDGAKATIEVGGVTVDVGGISKIGKEETSNKTNMAADMVPRAATAPAALPRARRPTRHPFHPTQTHP